MDLTNTAFGTWSGGRYMHFGEAITEERFHALVRHAYTCGIRTFVTADVYGVGRADSILGEALEGFPRESYALVGMIGHDIYEGKREGSKGYPRFTDAALRGPEGYADYVKMATEKSLERCRAAKFDLLLLHNPDTVGFACTYVWAALGAVKSAGLTDQLGIAPGPANGFTLDIVDCFEKHGEQIDWAMLILNPLEPWPGRLPLRAAEQHNIKVLTRVVDYGGMFWDDVKPGHVFREGDHRTWRPKGWVERGDEKLALMREIAAKHGLTLMQLASQWNLAQSPVKCVVPTFIQEAGEGAVPVEDKIAELAALPTEILLSSEEVEAIAQAGDNTGCMVLKGASARHTGNDPLPDQWPLRPELVEAGKRWGLGEAW